jgi:tetratricopeptide (TPR) repeat protein
VVIPSVALAVAVAVSALDASSTQNAEALFAAGEFTAAGAAYTKLLVAKPNNEDAKIGLARVDLYENRLDDAAALAHSVLNADSQNGTARKILADVSQRKAIVDSAAALDVPASGVVIPFLELDPLPLVQLVVDGRKANFLLDTGGPDVVLDPDFARELGLTISSGKTGVFAGGLRAEARRAVVEELQVGPLYLRKLSVGILPSRGLPLFKGR